MNRAQVLGVLAVNRPNNPMPYQSRSTAATYSSVL